MSDFQSHESKTRVVVENENTLKIIPKTTVVPVQGNALAQYNAIDIIL
jgi:hypothetical protein